MTRFVLFLAAVFLAASPAFALDLNGNWEGTMASQNGDLKIALVLKVDGEKLTGTVTNTYGESQITEGVVKGDDISFTVMAGGGQFKIVYKGKVAASDIKFKVTIGDFGDADLTVKRVT